MTYERFAIIILAWKKFYGESGNNENMQKVQDQKVFTNLKLHTFLENDFFRDLNN